MWWKFVTQNFNFHLKAEILPLATNSISSLNVAGSLCFHEDDWQKTQTEPPACQVLRKKWHFMEKQLFSLQLKQSHVPYLQIPMCFGLQQKCFMYTPRFVTQNIKKVAVYSKVISKLVIFIASLRTFLSKTGFIFLWVWLIIWVFIVMFTLYI